MTASPGPARRRRPRLALLALVALLCGCRHLERSLGPEAQQALTAALQAARPAWRWESAQVRAAQVAVRACLAASDRCFDLTLTEPARFCRQPAGPWCLRWDRDAPTAEEAAPLVRALAGVPESVWRTTEIPARPGEVFGLALVLVVVPLVGGAAAGALLRRRRVARLGFRLLLAVLPPAIAAGCLFRVPWGFHDLLSVGLLTSAGFVAGTATELRLRPLLGLTLPAAALLLGAAEWAARRLPPLPGTFELPTSASLDYRTDLQLFCGSLAFDERWSGLDRWSWPAPDDHRPMVIHLGDSMIFGAGVEASETAVEALNRHSPGVAHANFGLPGAAPDAELSILRRRFDRVPTAQLVVLHFFLGNDLEGLDERMVCCHDGPIFDYAHGHLLDRAALTHVRLSQRSLVERTPPPYPVRVLAPFSALARQSIRGFQLLTRRQSAWFDDLPSTPTEEKWDHLRHILRALRRETEAHGMHLVLSLLEERALLEADQPEQLEHWATRARLKELTRELGIETIDPWEPLRYTVRSGRRLFLAPAWEFHFNPDGHRWYAEWLLRTLGPRLTAPTAER